MPSQQDKPVEWLDKVLSQEKEEDQKIKIKYHLNRDKIDLKIEDRNKW